MSSQPTERSLSGLIDDELDPAYRRRVATVMKWLPPSPMATSHIIDIGCGRGYYLQYYAKLGQYRITGVELDSWTALQAEQAHKSKTNVDVIRADGAQLPLPDSSFSGAILSEILEHVPDDQSVLSEVYRVLRPGSILAITVPHAHYPWAWDPINWMLDCFGLSPIRYGCLAGIWAEHLRLYGIDDLRSVVQGAGFVIEEIQPQVRYCLPFSHNLLYGIGKPLLDSGLLSAQFAARLSRYRSAKEDLQTPSSLMHALHALFGLFDRRNRDPQSVSVPSVNLCLKARKPY